MYFIYAHTHTIFETRGLDNWTLHHSVVIGICTSYTSLLMMDEEGWSTKVYFQVTTTRMIN